MTKKSKRDKVELTIDDIYALTEDDVANELLSVPFEEVDVLEEVSASTLKEIEAYGGKVSGPHFHHLVASSIRLDYNDKVTLSPEGSLLLGHSAYVMQWYRTNAGSIRPSR